MNRTERQAFEVFVGESGDALLRIAVLLTADPDLAQDLYQQTLERLAARWTRVDNPKAFCRKVMHNLVIDGARALKRRPRELELLPAADAGDPRSTDPHAGVELRPALLAALQSLTPHQRAVVVLRYFDDRSESDVAELLNVSAGTVKGTASRAVAKLRAHPALAGLFLSAPC